MNIWLIAGMWAAYYLIHSLFAANVVKRIYRRWAPGIYKYYRFIYSLLAIVNFGLLFYLQLRQPSRELLIPYVFTSYSGGMLILLGAGIVFLSMRKYSYNDLLGIDEIQDGSNKEESDVLVTEGLNAYVRHPLYSGILTMLIGFFFLQPTNSNLVFCVVSLIYLFIGIWLEERKLLDKFGFDYQEYRRRTRMIIPYLL